MYYSHEADASGKVYYSHKYSHEGGDLESKSRISNLPHLKCTRTALLPSAPLVIAIGSPASAAACSSIASSAAAPIRSLCSSDISLRCRWLAIVPDILMIIVKTYKYTNYEYFDLLFLELYAIAHYT